MLLTLLVVAALTLTCTMCATRQMMLGFPSTIMWAIAGGQAYTLSTATWDIYYFIFFASTFGMTIFCAFAAYGLREKRDTIADEEMDEEGKGEGGFIDEKHNKPDSSPENGDTQPSPRTKALRARAEKRRKPLVKRKGEFDW